MSSVILVPPSEASPKTKASATSKSYVVALPQQTASVQISEHVILRVKCPYLEIFWSVFPKFGLNTGKYRREKLRIRTLFTHVIGLVMGTYLTSFTKFS